MVAQQELNAYDKLLMEERKETIGQGNLGMVQPQQTMTDAPGQGNLGGVQDANPILGLPPDGDLPTDSWLSKERFCQIAAVLSGVGSKVLAFQENSMRCLIRIARHCYQRWPVRKSTNGHRKRSWLTCTCCIVFASIHGVPRRRRANRWCNGPDASRGPNTTGHLDLLLHLYTNTRVGVRGTWATLSHREKQHRAPSNGGRSGPVSPKH
jgi:hypothetical protein